MQNSPLFPDGFFKKHAILLIMIGLVVIIGILLFSDFSKNPIITSEKINPYVLSTKGKTLIFRDKQSISVEENKQAPIFSGDKIRTLASTATVFWPDGSITRLGEKSSIKIHELKAKTANESIQIEFSLESGKSWSNVIKYMFGDSYFHERFNNDTALAAVRGTIFEVNLDNNYIHTIDHAVTIDSIGSHTGSTFVVAGGILDTNTRDILVQDRLDKAWNKVNNDADIIYLNKKMEAFRNDINGRFGQENYMNLLLEKIGLKKTKFSLQMLLSGNESAWLQFEKDVKKGGAHSELMDIYQGVYGLQNTNTIIDTKMRLRDLIIDTAPQEKKKMFLNDFARSSLFDSWDMIRSGTGNIEGLQKKLEGYMKQGADKILIDALKNAANEEKIQNINDTFENIKSSVIDTLSKKNLLEEAKKEINIENAEKINATADQIRNGITNGLKNIIQ